MLLQPVGQARRHVEAVARQLDRRLEQLAPGELAVLLVGQLEHGERARHADGNARGHGVAEAERLAVDAQEHRGRGAGRRRLAAVIDVDGAGGALVVQQEAAAAEARGLRLDDAQHHLDRNRGVDRRAAAAQHLEARLDGHRVCRSHHALRRGQARRNPGRAQHQQQRNDQEPAQPHARRATMNRRRKGNSVMPSARIG